MRETIKQKLIPLLTDAVIALRYAAGPMVGQKFVNPIMNDLEI